MNPAAADGWIGRGAFARGAFVAVDAMGVRIDAVVRARETARDGVEGIEVEAVLVTGEGNPLVGSRDAGLSFEDVVVGAWIPGGQILDLRDDEGEEETL